MQSDPELSSLIDAEIEFQNTTINLTAACNYISPLVSAAMRRELSNVHCEGYPGSRFHQGQQNADAIERLAVDRACRLFGADHANVQPYRGTMANLIASIASVETGGSILGFACDGGGHYSTGGEVHLTSRLFKVETYNVDRNSLSLDYEALRTQATQLRPQAIFAGDTSYTGLWDWRVLREIADDCGATLVADVSQTAGLIAAKVVDNPCEHADIVTLSTYKTLRGPRAAIILCRKEYRESVDRAVFPVCQDGTNLQSISGIAAALHEAGKPTFQRYCRQVLANSRALADALGTQGYSLVGGGTENHACLIDLTDTGLCANEATRTLATASIICNSNIIPFDSGTPVNPSGLRFGTPAATTLGMKVADMERIAGYIHRSLIATGNETDQASIGAEVREFRSRFVSAHPAVEYA